MTEYNFNGLTFAEQWLILLQGWCVGQKYPGGSPMPQPNKRSAQNLIKRGLMIEHEVTYQGMTVKEYEVPLVVHLAYCMSCGEEEE